MIVCYTSTHACSPKDYRLPSRKHLPPQDVKPLVASLVSDVPECFMRDHDTRSIRVRHSGNLSGVRRMFVNMRRVEPETAHDSKMWLDDERGQAFLVVGLCTIYLDKGSEGPGIDDFSKEIVSRTRLADQVIVAGYTADDLSMHHSEVLALKRARCVRTILEGAGLRVPVSTVSRPKCCFPLKTELCHRVEITSVHHGVGVPKITKFLCPGTPEVEFDEHDQKVSGASAAASLGGDPVFEAREPLSGGPFPTEGKIRSKEKARVSKEACSGGSDMPDAESSSRNVRGKKRKNGSGKPVKAS